MFFRQDINGLRAIAVVVVVLFHFGLPGFTGGFAGVDIFFVISGYLMTGIIFNKLERGNFSILDFYLARSRRIIPALIALCAVLIAAAWFILPPYELQRLGKHMVGATTFLSNFIFLNDSGYFDSSAHEKWLLHTWSLSVEWQFYIVLPILVVLLRKCFSLEIARWILLALACASFLLSVFSPTEWADANFYLLPTRAWEMMFGGLVYLYTFKIKSQWQRPLEFIGLALIAISVYFLNATVKWPGALALLPVCGAMLIIIANRQDSLITGNFTAQYLGQVSYSLYLWHWPIVVALSLFDVEQDPLWIIGGICASLIMAQLSYSFVEQYWRGNSSNKQLIKPLTAYASIMAISATAAFGLFYSKGAPWRVDELVAIADKEQFNRNPRFECVVTPASNLESPMCIYGDNTTGVAVIVIGDSHSGSTISAVAAAIPPGKGGALFLGADGCISLMDISTPYFYNCGAYNEKVLNYLNNNLPGIPIIVINHLTKKMLHPDEALLQKPIYLSGTANTDAAFASLFSSEYTERICKLSKTRPVYIMQPIPEMETSVPQAIVRAKMYRKQEIDITLSRANYYEQTGVVRKMIESTAEICGTKTLDPAEQLCNENFCLGSINKRPLYYDDDHLSEYGNKLLIPMFKKLWTAKGY